MYYRLFLSIEYFHIHNEIYWDKIYDHMCNYFAYILHAHSLKTILYNESYTHWNKYFGVKIFPVCIDVRTNNT